MKGLEIYIDGASKGNPGPSGIGVVICREGRIIKNISTYIGNATNNIAEYTALVIALQEALSYGVESIRILTDSQLIERQLNKVYKVRSSNIFELYNQALHLLTKFKSVLIESISREENRQADKLATLAIKKQIEGRQKVTAPTPIR